MTHYTVSRDHYNQEFDIDLYPGEVLEDGDLDADLMADLTAHGILVAEGVESAPEDGQGEDEDDQGEDE